MRKFLLLRQVEYFRLQWPPSKWCPKVTLIIFSCLACALISPAAHAQNKIQVSGTVADTTGEALTGVAIRVKGTQAGTTTDAKGHFSLAVSDANGTLVVTYIGFTTQEVPINGRTIIPIRLKASSSSLQEIVVTGYGTQKRESITGAISSVTSKDLERVHAGSTVSTGLAGKIPGVTFRQSEGRPGASASIQIRNMGSPLYVIDGIQQDEGQFNNLSPNDVESITVLKDGSAAIYGVRAANGVVVVTTKKGAGESRINIDAYTGYQNWTRFPNVLTSSYDYMRYKAEAEVNKDGSTSITPAELEKYKAGTDPGYRSFNWRDYVLKSNNNAPQNSVNANFTGGTDKVNYYVSATNLFQNSQLGKEYKFNRSNIQSNVSLKVANGLKVSLDINGRIETRENPGVPGGDDYFLAKFAVLRNTPLERPYANDNPAYLNDIGHTESNYAFLNKDLSGLYHSDWRVLQTNFNAEYQIPGVKGLAIKGLYSYYIADYLLNNQEYTYEAYTYRPETNTYDVTGGSTNPWREREQRKEFAKTMQAQLNYNNTFGKNTIGATFVAERIELNHLRNWIHASPISNNLPLIYFPTTDQYQDRDDKEARIGYIGRVNYNYDNKYYLEASARRDASYLFAPDKRVGYFPGVSAGWRITQEGFAKKILGENSVLNDLKFRASYGVLGDDRDPNNSANPIVAAYAYLPGYNYNQGTAILDGNAVTVSRDKGIPVTRISWLKSKITDVGMDFSLLNNKLTGSFDYFYRKRTGLLGTKNDVIVPIEIGYSLPQENANSDAQYGEEIALNYASKIGNVSFNVGGNFSFSRSKDLMQYNPLFENSWDQYRNSIQNRYSHIDWGYEVVGQFTSQEQINNYTINNDGKGNRSLLPGDLMYKDQNGDGKIDKYDERPIGFGYGKQPNINFGFTIGAAYKGFDFHADFSGGAGYTWFQNYETRWAFQNNGNLNTIFEDRWHRTDPFNVNSQWVPGKYPANRVNPGFDYSSYSLNGQNNSSFWLHSVKYLRARTIELGYSLPSQWLTRVKIKRARFYVNAYNLFSFDNLKSYSVDPEVTDDNGLQFPQSKVLNFGVNLTF
ncbi:SusC/RagA family TonB-linked outer membrane protein [Mucilaginibacter pocheonensis]|uniref:TonB-linked SusC/RagA family outer membrane protein n=1 Tax=Mucilaginibacter pocheonensis TaxID=398050 RepID=A0ABU1TCP3_9SPHI|nr:TonB-dependent receptor [Mucilaginibacter pocheonensis]MDR6943103.1 TonB-linked SusC/RagA family outer membrane protein [Mucilaginibacter pocheonensis]